MIRVNRVNMVIRVIRVIRVMSVIRIAAWVTRKPGSEGLFHLVG